MTVHYNSTYAIRNTQYCFRMLYSNTQTLKATCHNRKFFPKKNKCTQTETTGTHLLTSHVIRILLISKPSHCCSLATVTVTFPYRTTPSSGQYWVHLCRPSSTHLVVMTTTCTCCSQTIRQKSTNVFLVGPEEKHGNSDSLHVI